MSPSEDIPSEKMSVTAPKGSVALSEATPSIVVAPAQELRERFNIWSTLGIAYSITCTPLGIGTYLSVSIGVGGSPVYFFGYILAVGLNLLVCLSLAEIASVYPHSSAQIWWTTVLSPKKYSRVLSYMTGWFTSSAYFFWFAATALITSQLLWALVCVCKATFIVQPWHYYLVYVVFVIFSLVVNIPLIKSYPFLLKGAVFWINIGSLFILIALLVRTHPKQSGSFVFTDIVNLTGWDSNGVVFMLGLLPGSVAVNGFDCAAHMAEEMSHPTRQVPQVMVGSAVLSSISGLVMVLAYMFCNTSPDNLLDPIGSQPIAQLMLDAFDSTALTIIGILIFVISFLIATIALLTTFSRVWWSFAREGGVPSSVTMSKVNKASQLPVNAIIFGTVLALLIGLLELGASIALNAILGTSVLCIYVSYIIPIAALLFKRKSALPEGRYFNLGKAGPVCNVIAIIWMSYEFVWLTFPLYLPVEGSTMNYSVAVFVAIMLIATVNWFCYSKRVYVEPTEMVQNQHHGTYET